MIYAYSVEQIRAVEKAALARDGDATLMRRASAAVALAVVERTPAPRPGQRVVLLVGSGNNGGDALYAGAMLRGRGMAVTAVLLNPDKAHPAGLAALRRAGGRVCRHDDPGVGRLACHPSAMTTAAAMPASCETDSRQPVTPAPAAAAATVSITDSTGRPEDSEITLQSCHCIPAGAPNALATASLTANRAASDAGPRGRPAAVTISSALKSRAASAGVTGWRLSVSHDAGIAAAVVIALG